MHASCCLFLNFLAPLVFLNFLLGHASIFCWAVVQCELICSSSAIRPGGLRLHFAPCVAPHLPRNPSYFIISTSASFPAAFFVFTPTASSESAISVRLTLATCTSVRRRRCAVGTQYSHCF